MHSPSGATSNGANPEYTPIPRCELCKKRKVKCDRTQPSCGWCSRHGLTCEYKQRRKPGLRAGYGKELEKRLDKAEEMLRAHTEMLNASISNKTSTCDKGHRPPRVHGSTSPSHQSIPQEAYPIFGSSGPIQSTQVEAALFVQKPLNPTSNPPSAELGMCPTLDIENEFASQMCVPQVYEWPHVSGIQPSSPQGYFASGAQGNVHLSTAPVPHSTPIPSLDPNAPPLEHFYGFPDLYFRPVGT